MQPKNCILICVLAAAASVSTGAERMVRESARQIPVAYDVDIVVAGGTAGGVAAAVEAARQGARVFLAAPRPYLGEDLCGTYQLWLEPGEEPVGPLAKRLFAEPPQPQTIGKGLPFTYQTNRPASNPHRDTDPPSRLNDGKYASASAESVQYPAEVTITLDLGETAALSRLHVMAFQRTKDFEIEEITLDASGNGETWSHISKTRNPRLGQGRFESPAFPITAPVNATAKYLRLTVRAPLHVDRMLLGEIIVEPAESAKAAEEPDAARVPPMPMQIKRALDHALIDAGVEFLYGCRVTDVLCDANGSLAGVVMTNRSGRQAVRARVVIDATQRGQVARLAGARFDPFLPGVYTFKRIVVGGELLRADNMRGREMPSRVQIERTGPREQVTKPAYEYTLDLPLADNSYNAYAEMDHLARDKTWHPDQVAASEILFHIPPDAMKGRAEHDGDWPGADKIDLDVFRPADCAGMYVLGGCADVSRQAAGRMLRPLTMLALGRRIAGAAVEDADIDPSSEKPAAAPADLQGVTVAGRQGTATASGDTREFLYGVRPTQTGLPTVPAGGRLVPVLGEYDVVVVGGGTGGAPAGIGAARNGARTLVIEYLHGLGGVSTLGLIGKYYWGFREGFTAEVDRGVADLGGQDEPATPGWNIEWKMEWYRRELRKAGADVWYGVLGCGAFVEGDRVKGVIVATPEQRGVVLAKVVIDSTGNADIAAAAGARCIVTDGSHVAVQGTGLPPRTPGASYTNTDYLLADETDMIDMWRAFVGAKERFRDTYDLAQIVDTRERRRIVGDFMISPLDVYNGRTYPDTVGLSYSNFDTHGFTIHPLFSIRAPDKKGVHAYTPLRALVPEGIEGILVTGLGISAHRDAMPILRMQPDIQNQGYAAGTAAAMAIRCGQPLREIDIKSLQNHLVEKGNLPASVLEDEDNFPKSKEEIAAAVAGVCDGGQDLGLILAQPDDARPLLREAYASARDDKTRLLHARILGMLGDAAGVETLLTELQDSEWDAGWSFTGGGQFGASLSPVDSLIVALGKTRDPRAVHPILAKVRQLDASAAFSHHRAVAVALETIGDPAAAEPLADLLARPGMRGYSVGDISAARRVATLSDPNESRDQSLRELILARALYRCGDHEGVGEKILREYARDLRGHHARHAQAVLRDE
ncbi:MAG: FAD-dependent oxidoreductase [Phycisphaerae bacterium]|nr:FAD-dependent oxidoreductase [Phycisphaerae bacterium]